MEQIRKILSDFKYGVISIDTGTEQVRSLLSTGDDLIAENESLKLQLEEYNKANTELMKLYEAVLQGKTFIVDKEKRIIKTQD